MSELNIDFSLDEIIPFTELDANRLVELKANLEKHLTGVGRDAKLKNELDALQLLKGANYYKELATDDYFPEYDADNNIRARKLFSAFRREMKIV
jgi:hypothetical protein